MSWLDMAPRIALVLFLPSGVSLMASDQYGRDQFAGWPVVLAWLGAAVWLALVVGDHVLHEPRAQRIVKQLDLLARSTAVLGLAAAAIYALAVEEPFGATSNPKWLAAKVLLYALAIGCGIAIRFKLRPFGGAFGAMMASGTTPAGEVVMRRAVNGSIPLVATIWLCVLAAAALGVFKPGADL